MLCLNNTYHLGLKPGQEVLDAVGGAHKLQGWDRNILTDSGGLVINTLPYFFFSSVLLTHAPIAFKWFLC